MVDFEVVVDSLFEMVGFEVALSEMGGFPLALMVDSLLFEMDLSEVGVFP